MTSNGKRVALALGSGGARGYAHIGVIDVLQERGYEIVTIAGSSMGALVGGLAAAGRLAPYTEWVCGLTQRDVLRLLDPVLGAPGAIRMDRVLAKMSEILEGALIEDLPIPYTAVATDLASNREVWFQEGPLDVAIRASIAIPGVITPIVVGGRLLVDGGVLNPVPVEPTNATQSDLTIAVSLTGRDTPAWTVTPVKETSRAIPTPLEWLGNLQRGAAEVLEGTPFAGVLPLVGAAPHAEEPAAESAYEQATNVSIVDVTMGSLDAMTALITRYRMAGQPPDVLISVPQHSCGALEFHRAAEMIALGRRLAEKALNHLEPTPEPDAEPG